MKAIYFWDHGFMFIDLFKNINHYVAKTNLSLFEDDWVDAAFPHNTINLIL